MFPVILSGDYVRGVRMKLERLGAFTFEMPEDAIGTLAKMLRYAEYRKDIEVVP